MPEDPNLESARGHWSGAQAKLKHLKRSLTGTSTVDDGDWPRGWRRLRRTIERLSALLNGWGPSVEDQEAGADPERLRRRREMEARSLRVESALRELEQKQEAIDLERERSLAELERVHEGWRLLREESNLRPESLPEGTFAALVAKVGGLTALWERLSSQQLEASREHLRIEQSWRWLVSVALPTLEARAAENDRFINLPTLHRLISDLDRRWRVGQSKLREIMGEQALPGLREDLARALSREEALSVELEAIKDAERVQRQSETTRVASLSAEVDFLRVSIDKSRKETKLWQELNEAGRKDLDALMINYDHEQARFAELTKLLESSRDEVLAHQAEIEKIRSLRDAALARSAELERAMEAAGRQSAIEAAALQVRIESSQKEIAALNDALNSKTQRVAELIASTEALQAEHVKEKLEIAAERVKEKVALEEERSKLTRELAQAKTIPSIEPVLEPAWTQVLERLAEPLGSVYARLRRMMTAPGLSHSLRLELKTSTSAMARASDIVKVVREYLDEAGTSDGPARLERVLETALTAWEASLHLRRISLRKELEAGLPAGFCRPESLRLVFYQLIRNAYEAMPQGGELSIRLWKDAATDSVCAAFFDTGPGLSAEAQQQLYRPFFSGTPGHLGLGLALARRILRRCGGDIEVGNRQGGGVGAVVKLKSLGSDL